MTGGIGLFDRIDPRIWQAVIAGLFLAVGWIVNGAQNRRMAARLKAERLRDTHKAIYAEIGYALSALWDEGKSDTWAAAMQERIAGDPDFVPFIPKEHHDHIYDAVLDEIEVLPRQTIDAIVAYYSQIKALGALAEDMRGDGFRRLEPERRALMYGDYIAMRQRAFAAGEYALALITTFAAEGAAATERRAAEWISSRAAGQNGRAAGSE